jgi:hypothetical protein
VPSATYVWQGGSTLGRPDDFVQLKNWRLSAPGTPLDGTEPTVQPGTADTIKFNNRATGLCKVYSDESPTVGCLVGTTDFASSLTIAGTLTISGRSGMSNDRSTWDNNLTGLPIILYTHDGGVGTLKLVNHANLTIGDATDADRAGVMESDSDVGTDAVPRVVIQGGSALYLGNKARLLDAKVTVDGSDGTTGDPSLLCFKDNMSTNALFRSRNSVNISNGGAMYFYGGNAAGTAGGITGINGYKVPITVTGTGSIVADLSATDGNVVAIDGWIDDSDGALLIAKNQTLQVSGDANNVGVKVHSGGAIDLAQGSVLESDVTMDGNGGGLWVGFDWTEPRTQIEYMDGTRVSAEIDGDFIFAPSAGGNAGAQINLLYQPWNLGGWGSGNLVPDSLTVTGSAVLSGGNLAIDVDDFTGLSSQLIVGGDCHVEGFANNIRLYAN